MRIYVQRLLGFVLPLASAFAAPPVTATEAMSFRVAGQMYVGETAVVAEGEIVSGTAARFVEFMRSNAQFGHVTVVFNSPGGNLAEGMELGRIIRQLNIGTSIGTYHKQLAAFEFAEPEPGICYSACAFAYLGGVDRNIHRGRYGVHRFYRTDRTVPPSAIDDTQRTVADLQQFIISMDVSPELIQEMVRAGANEINVLDAPTMERLKVTTSGPGDWELVNDRGDLAVLGIVRRRGKVHELKVTCVRGRGPSRLVATVFHQDAIALAIIAPQRVKVGWYGGNATYPLNSAEVFGQHVAKGFYKGRSGVLAVLPVNSELANLLLTRPWISFSLSMGALDDFVIFLERGREKLKELAENCR